MWTIKPATESSTLKGLNMNNNRWNLLIWVPTANLPTLRGVELFPSVFSITVFIFVLLNTFGVLLWGDFFFHRTSSDVIQIQSLWDCPMFINRSKPWKGETYLCESYLYELLIFISVCWEFHQNSFHKGCLRFSQPIFAKVASIKCEYLHLFAENSVRIAFAKVVLDSLFKLLSVW